MQMAIYRSCACLELNQRKSPLKVEKRSVDILTSSLLVWYWWPVTAVSDSKHQHCWCRSGKQVSASKTQLAASVTQYFCRVDEALWLIQTMHVYRQWACDSAHNHAHFNPSYLGVGYITPTKQLTPNFTSLDVRSAWRVGVGVMPFCKLQNVPYSEWKCILIKCLA